MLSFAATYGDLTYEIENNQIIITDCNYDATVVDIPSMIDGYPVTTIDEAAFHYCKNLTNITIPDSVTIIGVKAFHYCESLTSINVDNKNTHYSSVDGNLFNKNKTILIQYAMGKTDTSYIIPSGVTRIGDYAFHYCKNLTTITVPDGVIKIGDYAFHYCEGLTNINIPESVTTIGEHIFYGGSESLTNISVDNNNLYYSSIDGSLFNKNKTILIQYAIAKSNTSYIIPAGVTTIGVDAFRGCVNLTNVTIPDSVTTIGNAAFMECTRLTTVSIGDSLTTISSGAFSDCTSLININIPNGIITIGTSAFARCESLTTITIPDSVMKIDDYAFHYCISLTDIYYNGTKQEWEKIVGDDVIYENTKVMYNSAPTEINSTKDWNSSFSDVPSNHWAYDAIMELADLGVINGMGDGTYNPNGTVTREQFIKLLVCANDEDNDFYPEVDFADVEDNSWSYEYICAGLSNGIFDLNELNEKKFKPQEGIDRDTVALWAVNTLGVWLDEESDFNDNYKIDNSEAVATAVDEGIIKGYEDNTFRPNNTLTRAEAATIIKRTLDKIADNKTIRLSPNIVEKNDSVEDIYSDNNTNTLVDFDADKGYYKFKNINEDIEALTRGDIFTIPPSYEIPAGLAIKVKTIDISGATAEIWSDSIEADEVFDEIDISTMISGDLGYVAENSVPKGIEVTNAKGQTIAMAKEALKVDNNYFYASTGGFQQTLKGTEELDLLKFKLEYEKDSHTKISGEITVLNPQFVVDFKYSSWYGLQYAELKAVLSCDAEVKYEKKLESREEDLTRIPLAKLVMPVGATGLYLEGDLYCDVGIDGKVEVKFETSQSFETGIKYENKKLKNIKEQKNESEISATAEGAIKFGPNTELTLSAYGVINLKFGFEAGVKLDMMLAKDVKEENGVMTYHKCDLCIDGDLSGYFEVGGDITVGKGIFKVTVIEAKNEWEYIIADFYISRQLKEDKGIFGWGECENYKTNDGGSQSEDVDDNEGNSISHGETNFNGLGNIHQLDCAVSDGEYIYISANKKIYRTDLDGGNQIVFSDIGDMASSMIIYDGYLYFSRDGSIYRISLKGGKVESFMDVSLGSGACLQIVNNSFLYAGSNGKIYTLSLDAESPKSRVYIADGHSPIYYDGVIYYTYGKELYRIDYNGDNKELVLPYRTYNLCVYNDRLYFRDDYKIYSTDLNGENKKELYYTGNPVNSLNIYNGCIYFVAGSSFNRMSLNGENVTVVSSGCWYNICVAGNWFFTRSSDNFNTVKRAKDMMNFEKIED